MKSYRSLSATINWSMIIIALLSVCMVGTLWIFQEYRKSTAELRQQKEDYIAAKKAEIKTEVDRVIAYIDHQKKTTEQHLKESIKTRVYEAHAIATGIYNANRWEKSDKEIQQMIREALRPLIFNNGRGYFFIYDIHGNSILLPFSPYLEGTSLLELVDSKGNPTIQKTIKMIHEKGEGFQRWHWFKPGENGLMSEKVGFSKHFEPYDWWLGSGEYIEDFEQDVQKETLAWINQIRFGQDGYIFVYHFNGTILAHFMRETIGHNVLQDTSDPYGIKTVGELIRISQREEQDFHEYQGLIRPSTGLRAEKVGHAQSVNDWQWAVGAGVYIDSINDVIAVERKNLIKTIRRNILNIVFILVIAFVIIGVILRYISQKTTDNLTVFTRFFDQASTKSIKISDGAVHFSEFKFLADSANQMVDDRKRAEEELTKLRIYLSNIINSMPSILIGVDSEGSITQWNNEASRVTGISASSASGQPFHQAFPRLANIKKALDNCILKRQILRDHRKHWQEDGETHYEDVTIYPLITNGIEGAVIRVDDVTEKVRLEEMMIQSEKMLSVGGLAAGMAHEINNPMASVMQTAEVMANRLSSNSSITANRRAAEKAGITLEAIDTFMAARDIPRMLTTIRKSGRRVSEIVDNMLSFARKSEAAVSSHTLGALLDKILDLAATDYDLKREYDFKKINIVKNYDANLPVVLCDGSQIQQVLLNLIRNGAQAMQAAGTDNPQLIFRTYVDRKRYRVCLEIEDNGPGMDDATRKRIFEPFFTTKPVGVGTGLGLSVSYFIITETHKGEMDVESQPGAGTKFTIRLPAAG